MLKTIVTIDFTSPHNYGLKDDICQYWYVSNFRGVDNHKKLLSLLNLQPSLCVEFEISSKLKHLLLFLQNYGLTDGRCQHWQLSILAGIKNYKKLLPPLNSSPSICAEYEILSKLKHLLFFIQNYGLKDDRYQHWQVSRITENYCHQWIQYLQIVHYAKMCGKWLTSFPVPHFKDNEKTAPFQSESVSIYSKPYTPILLTVSNNTSHKSVINRVKSLISYNWHIIIETLEH